jgi:xanthine dehydrogenase YagR molybdenum-binding subunit
MTDLSRRGFLGLVGVAAAAPKLATAADPPAGASTVEVTVNGVSHALAVAPEERAVDVLRGALGLKGTKEACGHGACGACAIQVDGVAVNSCLLPATALHGRSVVTVEGLAPGATGVVGLHAAQKAMAIEDALQCGYCTPGCAVELAAFVDQRAKSGVSGAPTDDEVTTALSGHLCRCGAYPALRRAVVRACAGDVADVAVAARPDAFEKLTGKATYTVDVSLPGMLEGRILRAHHARAAVRTLDASSAAAVPGVKAVHVMLVGGNIRYSGQPIVAIAAVDRASASAGVAAVRLELDPSPPVLDADLAAEEGASEVFAAERELAPSAAEGPVLPARWKGNVRGPYKGHMFLAPLEAERTVDDGGAVVRARFTTSFQCHTALEPHCAVAKWEGDTVEVWASTQSVSHLAEDIAQRWKLPISSVRVHAPYVGGGFGAKAALYHEIVAAIELARSAGAPVRVVPDRDEELASGGNRPATRIDVGVALADDGLDALTLDVRSNSGVAVGHSVALLGRLIYPSRRKRLIEHDVVTNLPPSVPFRGPGGPQAAFAIEQSLDILAHTHGIDPLALRRKIDPNPGREGLYALVGQLPLWKERGPVAASTGRFRRGVGMAAAAWFHFVEPASEVQLEATPDGRLVASTGAQDMGNGTRAMLAHAVAKAYGTSPELVTVNLGDSELVHGPMSGGSRTTPSLTPTAEDAVAQLKEALIDVAARASSRDVEATDTGVRYADGTTETWAALQARAPKITVIGRRRRDPGGYVLPFPVAGLRVGKALTGAVTVVAVEVDTLLGRIRVTDGWCGVAAGRIVAPAVARSQVEGGFTQGIGYALYEERRVDPSTGALVTHGLEDYRLPGIGDVPSPEVVFYEGGYDGILGGAGGLAEVTGVPVAAAIGNAVFHATGWRPHDLPLRLDRVAAGVRS